jgi:hypothetical protein
LLDHAARGGVSEAECAPDLGTFVVDDWHGVHLCSGAQLEPVLDASEKSVGVGETPSVVLVDIPCCSELVQGGERPR